MRIVWHGHSCFEMDDGNITVVVDPHDGKSIGIKPPSASANVVLMTHNHYDHSAARIIRGIHKDFMESRGVFNASGMKIEGLPSLHDSDGGKKFGSNTIYLFEMDSITVCHCGDIGEIPSEEVLAKIRNVDVLMVPTGETNTMKIESILELIALTSPKVIIPMHYHMRGLSIPFSNVEKFLGQLDCFFDFVGSEMDISKDELPQKTECWVFSL